MGLLDSILGAGGGLFGSNFASPLFDRPEMPQYDAMGNYTGITPQAQSPFPVQPIAPGSFSPAAQPSVFNGGAAAFNQFAGIPVAPSAPEPPQAAIPPNAQPTQGTLPPLPVSQVPPAPQPVAQPQMPPPPAAPTAPPAFLQQQSPDGFQGAMRGFLANAHNGPLGAIFGGLAGAAGMGQGSPQDIARQNLKAQYDALAPIVGPQKAMLAVMNPEAGKIIMAQALEKKQYGFQKLDNDTVVRQDPQTGKVEVAYGNAQAGTITGPDGKPIEIPQGVDRKAFVGEISRANAKAAAGEKTGEQAKAEGFANKMELANKSIAALEGQGSSLAGKIASGIPLGNYVQSQEYQRYKQASSNFITALLRQESGAAIGKEEFNRYDREYMPQPGDSPEVLAQKSEARRVAIEAMKKGAGPGYKSPATEQPKVRVYNPTTGRIE